MSAIAESVLNVTGLTRYIDDLPEPAGLLHAAVCSSPCSRGRLTRIGCERALAVHPSVRVLTAADIPGENELGPTVADEPLLAAGGWNYFGEPVALVLADTRAAARRAARRIDLEYEPLEPNCDARRAAAEGRFILPPRTMRAGDPAAAFARAATVVSGRVESGGQEHVYLETQSALAELREGGRLFVVSGTQAPTGVQRAIARALGLPMNAVEVEAPRLGGGFGGKEDQAVHWAALAALGAWCSSKPVKLVLSRRDDMRWTGKRHPYSTDYRLGLDADGRLLAFEADYYQNSGACCDLSPAILSRTLFHAASAYNVPNLRVTGYMCRTNLPPFTAFRGFGAPQAIFVIEAALDAAAAKAGLDPVELRRRNLLREGDTFHFGMPVLECRTLGSMERLLAKVDWPSLRAEIDAFNASHRLEKRGAAILPLCFGISFTKLMMNQGGALVHVYTDGSVAVNTGAVEMGQQVARKIGLVAARGLGLPVERIRVERTRTALVANTQPTAASTGSDLNGMAALLACREIRGRLIAQASLMLGAPAAELSIEHGQLVRSGKPAGLSWDQLVAAAHEARIDLSAHAFYSTPGLFYDMAREQGSPFAYHVYGCACVTVRLDVLRAVYRVESATIVHDVGESLDPAVDLGQTEGALAQGLGWALLEDLRYDEAGRLLTDTLSTYKLPDVHFMPEKIDIEFMADAGRECAVLRSKAVGEPPFMYGIAAWFALLDALRAARPDGPLRYELPFTPERCLDFLTGAAP